MSLLDALLLDPYRINTWIAYRNDGVKGSGTQNDPYDGSTSFTTISQQVTNLTYSGLVATATIGVGHTLSNNDVVTIENVTGVGAAQWNGTFIIYNVQSTSFNYMMNSAPAAGAAGLPVNPLKVPSFRFDGIMNILAANTCVHLGPTTANRPFLRKGFKVEGALGLSVKPAMKIMGSGIDVTTLRLVGQAGTCYAIGHDFAAGMVDYFEISDVSIDCNQMVPTGLGNSACGAVRVMGNHARVRRIKVLNWGANAAVPLFVVSVVTADSGFGLVPVADCGIEEVIAISPASSPSGALVTVLHSGPKDDSGTNAEGYGMGPFIRNCFVDCGSPTAMPEYRGLSMAWCKGGVVEGNQVHNTKFGGPYISKSSSRDLVVRNNFYKNVSKGPFWNLATLSATSLTTLARDLIYDSSGKTAVATLSNHGLLAGDRVKIAISSGPSLYVGIFVVSNVPATDKFRYTMASDPGSGSVTGPTMQKIFGVAKLVVEGNTIELATGSTGQIGVVVDDSSLSPQTPDYAHGDVIVRDNKFRYLDGTFDPGSTGYGIHVNGAKNLLVRNNVVESTQAHPIANRRCGSVKCFNNKKPDGTLIQGYNADTDKKYDELETDAEDALVLALFKRT